MQIIDYLFIHRENVLFKFVYHSNKFGICELIPKLLEFDFLSDDYIDKLPIYEAKREEVIFSLMKFEIPDLEVNTNQLPINYFKFENQVRSSISYVLLELIENNNCLNSVYENKAILDLLFKDLILSISIR